VDQGSGPGIKRSKEQKKGEERGEQMTLTYKNADRLVQQKLQLFLGIGGK